VADLAALLIVQQHDTVADRLRHRRATLAERAELARRENERSLVDSELADARARRAEVVAREKRLEDEATSVEAKAKDVERTLYGGTVSNVKELQAMQADVEHLRNRRNDLEEQELVVMEEREALDREVAELEARLAAVDDARAVLQAAIAEHELNIDTELATEQSARAEAAATLPDALLAMYESIRTKNKGAGAARLVGDTCQSCRLALPATEVDRIRRLPEGELARCDNCGALLVRE